MATNKSYEIISLKDGRWETESIVYDKNEAIGRAQETLNKRFFSAVKVIEERFDEETGEAKCFIVFNKKNTLGKKKSQYTGPERRKGREWRDNPKGYLKKVKKKRKENRKTTFMGEIIKLVVILGGILTALILLVLLYISYFKGKV